MEQNKDLQDYYRVVDKLNESEQVKDTYSDKYTSLLRSFGVKNVNELNVTRKREFYSKLNEESKHGDEAKDGDFDYYKYGVFVYTVDGDECINTEYARTPESAIRMAKRYAENQMEDVYVEVWEKDKDGSSWGNTGSPIWKSDAINEEKTIDFYPVRTVADLKYNVGLTGSHFFDHKTMKFFGDSMSNYGMRHLKEKGVYELYRKRPVNGNLKSSTYFDDKTFERVHNHNADKYNLEESTPSVKESLSKNIKEQKEILTTLLKEEKGFDTYVADADDVVLVVDNTKKFYDTKIACFKSLTRKKKSDIYDKAKAPIIFKTVVNNAAKFWYDETVKWADDGKSIVKAVTKEVKDEACKLLAQDFEDAFANQEYDFMETKKKIKESIFDEESAYEKQSHGQFVEVYSKVSDNLIAEFEKFNNRVWVGSDYCSNSKIPREKNISDSYGISNEFTSEELQGMLDEWKRKYKFLKFAGSVGERK